MPANDEFLEFNKYIDQFAERLEASISNGYVEPYGENQFRNYLYGCIRRQTLKSYGSFFTSSDVAKRLVSLAPCKHHSIRVVDPACGCGDLLLSLLPSIGTVPSLKKTLELYSESIHGFDIVPAFVECTKLRIVHFALTNGSSWDLQSLSEATNILRNIKCCNALEVTIDGMYNMAIINPPFSKTLAPHVCTWGRGTVTSAALFVEWAMQNLESGGQLLAVLPDVIRSGTRYSKFRQLIAKSSTKLKLEIVGRFDQVADVDVFLLSLTKSVGLHSGGWGCEQFNGPVLGDTYTVRVGPVVPHRDPETGPLLPFLTSRTCPPWGEVQDIKPKRYGGPTFKGPFVVIRRTSGPQDQFRCVPTLISDTRDYAIENHLLVLTPKDGSLESCRALMEFFKSNRPTAWINETIRCRHLTVSSVKQIPFK